MLKFSKLVVSVIWILVIRYSIPVLSTDEGFEFC